MTDLEITLACAKAMGWKHLGAVGVAPPKRGEPDSQGYWCLSGGNDWWLDPEGRSVCAPCSGIPDPLHDDAQAMALVRKFEISIAWSWVGQVGCMSRREAELDENKRDENIECTYRDLNRAICECVAKMMREKVTP